MKKDKVKGLFNKIEQCKTIEEFYNIVTDINIECISIVLQQIEEEFNKRGTSIKKEFSKNQRPYYKQGRGKYE